MTDREKEIIEYIKNLKPTFIRPMGANENTDYTTEDFLNKFDFVTDPNLARELLCITPLAWEVISSDLKQKDHELHLYHQPVGLITFEKPIFGTCEKPVWLKNVAIERMNLPLIPKSFNLRIHGDGSFMAIPTEFPNDSGLGLMYILLQKELLENAESIPLFDTEDRINFNTIRTAFGSKLDNAEMLAAIILENQKYL